MEDALKAAAEGLLPALIEGLALVLMAALTWAAAQFTRKTGLSIEEKHRDALHTAIMSGVSSAMAKLQKGVAPSVIAAEAIRHAQASVPDAIAALKPGVDVLTNIALAKLETLLAVQAAPATAPIPTTLATEGPIL